MKKVLISSLLIILLAACGPTRDQLLLTVTVEEKTAEAMRVGAFQTQTAEPSRTSPQAVASMTSDVRSSFDKCVSSGQGIRYVISGNGVSGVSLTWQNDTNGTVQGDYQLPFCITYLDFHTGDFIYISAQIIEPTSGAGAIQCIIYDGKTIISKSNANGFASIATCDGMAE